MSITKTFVLIVTARINKGASTTLKGRAMRLQSGQIAPDFDWTDVHGQPISLSSMTQGAGAPVLLSFYRYASCPLCNLRVNALIGRYAELEAQGLKLIAIFQSSADSIRGYVGKQDSPFPILADPDKQLYSRYGVEGSASGLLKAAGRMGDLLSAAKLGFTPGRIDGELSMVPADFLIGPDQVIAQAYYGRDIGDHMPMSQVDEYARQWRG